MSDSRLSSSGRSALLRVVFATLAMGLLYLCLEPATAFASEAVQESKEGWHYFKNAEGHAPKGAAFLFWILALTTVGGSLFVITRRNMVTAVMGMVGTFFAIGGLYLMLYASFLAVMQVLVYAGAIMVLFVFVIMILNRPEEEPWAIHGLLGKGIAAIGLLYIFKHLAGILWKVKETHPLISDKAELAMNVVLNRADPKIATGAAEALTREYEFGSVRGVGYTLFTDYLFPFEAVSIVLLVAVVGAIAIARPAHPEEDGPDAEGQAPAEEAS